MSIQSSTSLRKCTSSVKAAIRRLEPIKKFAIDHKDNASKVSEFNAMFEESQKIYDGFQHIYSNIKDEYSEKEYDDLENLVVQLDQLYFKIKTEHVEFQHLAGSHNPTKLSEVNVKLPRIQLPTFSGNIMEWPTYIELFNVLIHSNSNLSDIEKFQYLLSSLLKEPLSIVKSLPLISTNYVIAYNSLKTRYENKRVLAFTYWQNLYDSPKTNSNSPESLRSLINCFSENLAALKTLDIDLWDFTLVNWVLHKLDINTKKRFEMECTDVDIPSFESLNDFLIKDCKAMESVSMSSSTSNSSYSLKKNEAIPFKKPNKPQGTNFKTFATKVHFPQCLCCKKDHFLYMCENFHDKSISDRQHFVNASNLCTNCLGKHSFADCLSKSTCRVCQKKHHTLLHSSTLDQPTTNSTVLTTNLSHTPSTVLLSTVIVAIRNSKNIFIPCRALIDSASQSSFITNTCLKNLDLPMTLKSISIQGVNDMSSATSAGSAQICIRPIHNSEPIFHTEVTVLPSICNKLPSTQISTKRFNHLKNLALADPNYATPGDVDLLLGTELFPLILREGRKVGPIGQPSAINTIFGWMLCGRIQSSDSSIIVHSYFVNENLELTDTLKKFWELEKVPEKSHMSPDDLLCENIYSKTISRLPSGRYTVALPFCELPVFLGDSYTLALQRLFALERRLSKDPELRTHYCNFLKDYLDSNHMCRIPFQKNLKNSYFIPHHCVKKLDSSTTPIRVVFNASAKTSNGASLNDKLLVGPKLQQDISSILLRFRFHSIVFTADIKQMYRQILIKEDHQSFQQILWRFNISDPVEIFQLKTVTYGVTSAPFLAIRTLQQLANDERENYPIGSQILSRDMYVDDLVSGCTSTSDAFNIQNQLLSLLTAGGFELRKWSSNFPALLKNLPISLCQNASQNFDSEDSTIKVLGLQWNSVNDYFTYSVKVLQTSCTKRSILSEIARIFDPLGLLSPITLFAKQLMQQLWLLGIDWDSVPPNNICAVWSKYKIELPCLSNLQLPRQIIFSDCNYCELHGFSDASEIGMACVIYLRSINSSGEIKISLICGKSRVTPLNKISIPRAELCAALLLSNLMDFVLTTFTNFIAPNKIFAWTDSTVTLTWIKSSPHLWKTFISNRVSLIQEKIPPQCWYHIPGTQNPADCASRGLFPEELLSHSLWWAGPPWLRLSCEKWPELSTELSPHTELERKVQCYVTAKNSYYLDQLLTKFSSLRKIQGIIAYVLRFITNLKTKSDRQLGPLSKAELYHSLVILSKYVQSLAFRQDIDALKSNKSCSKSLRKLAPFFDSDGVLRVGGRLRHSQLQFDSKHPILLPREHKFTELIINHFHNQTLHTGHSTLRFLINQQFWILSAKRAINQCLSKCYKCFKANPKPSSQFMGDLPSVRVSQVKPFSCSGVDFAGPFTITLGKHRGSKTFKAYLCLFICMATKALHLELVSDLTSEAFIAAFRRFVARRGRVSDLYSDCGTNFVGANNILRTFAEKASETLSLKWHFNPPSSPHMGGIWESGVKSVKGHLIRVVGQQILTYEELNTLLVQIESILNSRPLYALSNDPNDLSVLTPNHFLTLEPVTAPPDESYENLKINRLNRWQLIQQFQESIWRRWHLEYLHSLQQRQKWFNKTKNLEVGSLVIIKNDNTPPYKWPLGRILALHPGADNIARVATIRTSQGCFKRPVVKLCVLPHND